MREVPKFVVECCPGEDSLIMNPFFKCMMKHAEDECNSGAASIMVFSKPLALVQLTGDWALVAVRMAQWVEPMLVPQLMPQKCMAIVMGDPDRAQAVCNGQAICKR